MQTAGWTRRRLKQSVRVEIRQRVANGERLEDAARAVGCRPRAIRQLVWESGGGRPRLRPRSPLRLSAAEREEISRRLKGGESLRAIGRRLGRAPSTISREVAANLGRQRYRAWRAELRAAQLSRRPKRAKLSCSPRLRAEVERLLTELWSPQQIAARLRRGYPADEEMRVSAETIYQSLFVQSRGALRRELSGYLRTQRSHRRPQGRTSGRGRLRDMVNISQRPAEAADRAVPGHWEGDLVMGRAGRSAIGTLVERSTRFVMLLALPEGRTAPVVRDALASRILTLPEQLRRSLTWDQGKEMAEHIQFTLDTGVAVYFCDPHSPWQRGSNENTNGLLRQYFPKNADLAGVTQEDLDRVAAQLNGRPRQTLDWMTPSEALAAVLR
jgi:IS30 family transposase